MDTNEETAMGRCLKSSLTQEESLLDNSGQCQGMGEKPGSGHVIRGLIQALPEPFSYKAKRPSPPPFLALASLGCFPLFATQNFLTLLTVATGDIKSQMKECT